MHTLEMLLNSDNTEKILQKLPTVPLLRMSIRNFTSKLKKKQQKTKNSIICFFPSDLLALSVIVINSAKHTLAVFSEQISNGVVPVNWYI